MVHDKATQNSFYISALMYLQAIDYNLLASRINHNPHRVTIRSVYKVDLKVG